MVRWLEHAMYQPSVRQLVWSQGKTSTPLWNQWARHESIFPCPNPAVGSARGQLIHNLPWGATPETMGLAWVDLVDGPCPAMSPYHTLPDKGHGLVMALNQVLRAAHTPTPLIRGTVDHAVVFRGVRTGVELKTGAWKYAQVWAKQIERHLTHYPRVLLVMVTPEAALGTTPALVSLSN